ncbi:hypothetical protein AB0L85_06710 [Streptomyces sp. NPDC052051]|uniref:hypothetical protein n=1 Tax=Streptomyces sp. NPDC052051 TaxID=3154649 RepID=UPI00341E7D95
MTTVSEMDVLKAYEWSDGQCSKCGREDTRITVIRVLGNPPEKSSARACEGCVIKVERSVEDILRRASFDYSPGLLGRAGGL